METPLEGKVIRMLISRREFEVQGSEFLLQDHRRLVQRGLS